MDAATRHFLTCVIVTVDELSQLTGISKKALQQRAYRGTIEYVSKGAHQGLLLFDARDFAEHIARFNRKNGKRSS